MRPLRRRQLWFTVAYAIFTGLTLASLRAAFLQVPEPQPVPYNEFLRLVRDGAIDAAEIRDTAIVARKRGDSPPRYVVTERIPGVDETALLEQLDRQGVTFSGRHERVSFWKELLLSLAPFLLLAGLYYAGMRRVARTGGPLDLGRHRAKIHDVNEGEARVTFADVAGVDEAEAELVEVVDFLRNPEKYRSLGARIPKGVLLVGPPGTGKTLLARAVAGEAGVPFFSISGSEFVEMFVGMGAARVRDLFEQAKRRAPCIVFIDELDAIGKSRGGVAALATHDEREQTLNQLLVEMDGFDTSSGVMIMAATNRPEILDPALLRAGRFDRQVVVDRPDVRGREEILRVHCRTVKLGPSVDLSVVARRTPGMVGADLANVVNEAALAAARRRSEVVEAADFDEAIDRIQLGLKRRGLAMREDEKRRVAYHESGHALVALSVAKADPVHRVTIIPRSVGALGATLQLPTDDRYLVTKEELEDRICVMLGGRVAEEVACGDVSTGAHDDLERATEIARQMVCRFGMSARLGPMTFGREARLRFLEGLSPAAERDFSEETARAIDAEVRAIVDAQHARARGILARRRGTLTALAERLLAVETLDRAEIDRIVARPEAPAAAPAGRPAADPPPGAEPGANAAGPA